LPLSSIGWSRAELKLNGHTLGTPIWCCPSVTASTRIAAGPGMQRLERLQGNCLAVGHFRRTCSPWALLANRRAAPSRRPAAPPVKAPCVSTPGRRGRFAIGPRPGSASAGEKLMPLLVSLTSPASVLLNRERAAALGVRMLRGHHGEHLHLGGGGPVVG
jgi:hypothetical protein